MSSSTSEEKKNPVVALKAQAEKFNFSMLRADKNNKSATTGEQMYKDFRRMRFVINGKSLDETLIGALIEGAKQRNLDEAWDEHYADQEIPGDKKTDQYKESFKEFYNLGKKHTHLLPKEGDENKNYRPIAKEIFKEMFGYGGAKVPSDSILEELITSCNQLGYEGNLSFYVDTPALGSHGLSTGVLKKTININCTESSYIKIESKISTFVLDPNKTIGYKSAKDAAIATIQSSIRFALESQDGKDDVTYKDGKLSLTVPKRLRDYNMGDKNLFDVIKECFQKLCEKFGFFKIKIGHELDKQPKVNNHLESVEPPVHSNEHGNTP